MWIKQLFKGKNFGVVEEGKIYRSALPSLKDLETYITTYKLKSVLDLRDLTERSAPDYISRKTLCLRNGVNYTPVPLDDRGHPHSEDVDQLVNFISDPANQPVLVHCKGGRHRTGGIIAVLRYLKYCWAPEKAMKEAKEFGFYSQLGHAPWEDVILHPWMYTKIDRDSKPCLEA